MSIIEYILPLLIGGAIIAIAFWLSKRQLKTKKKSAQASFYETLSLTGVPIMTMISNDKELNFMVDTGSDKCYIDSKLIDDCDCRELPYTGEVAGLGGKRVKTKFYELNLLTRDGLPFTHEFQAFDMSKTLNPFGDININGILGSDFFFKHQYIIDFDSLIIYQKK